MSPRSGLIPAGGRNAVHDDLTGHLPAQRDHGSQALALSVLHVLGAWLAHPISEADKKMAQHLQQAGFRGGLSARHNSGIPVLRGIPIREAGP